MKKLLPWDLLKHSNGKEKYVGISEMYKRLGKISVAEPEPEPVEPKLLLSKYILQSVLRILDSVG